MIFKNKIDLFQIQQDSANEYICGNNIQCSRKIRYMLAQYKNNNILVLGLWVNLNLILLSKKNSFL